jgi:hypothetical protein
MKNAIAEDGILQDNNLVAVVLLLPLNSIEILSVYLP